MQLGCNSDTPEEVSTRATTKHYRLDVLNLCHKSQPDNLTWEVRQHFLDRLWIEALPDKHVTCVSYICPSCGAALHPGFEATQLRVQRCSSLKSERTRRRRHLRKQKRAAITREQESKRSKKNESKGRCDPQSVDYVLLRDDPNLEFDRNYLMLRCGNCACKIRLKCLKREISTTKQAIISNQGHVKGVVVKSSKASIKDDSKVQAVDGDFLSLPPVPKGLPASRNINAARALLQTGKQGKKKKGNNIAKKSKLLSFLSSLND